MSLCVPRAAHAWLQEYAVCALRTHQLAVRARRPGGRPGLRDRPHRSSPSVASTRPDDPTALAGLEPGEDRAVHAVKPRTGLPHRRGRMPAGAGGAAGSGVSRRSPERPPRPPGSPRATSSTTGAGGGVSRRSPESTSSTTGGARATSSTTGAGRVSRSPGRPPPTAADLLDHRGGKAGSRDGRQERPPRPPGAPGRPPRPPGRGGGVPSTASRPYRPRRCPRVEPPRPRPARRWR